MSRLTPRSIPRDERGAALLTVILLLLLVSVLVAAYTTTITGERAMSSSVHVGREALYAADAGVRLAEQRLANLGKTKLDSLVALYNGSGGVIKTPSLIFPKGALVNSSTNPAFNSSSTITYTDSVFSLVSQVYNYEYTITSTGTQSSTGNRQIVSTGILRMSAGRGSFADYLMFTNNHTMPDGSAIWFTSSGSFQGRVHTNGEFRFQGRPSFADLATSVNSRAWYYNNGSNIEVNDDHYRTTDVPNFYGGFKRSQPSVNLPTNAYNQQNASIGGDPLNTTPPSNSTINTAIGSGAGTGTPPTGVYVPNTSGTVNGGIYVQGNLDQCVLSVSSGNQVYTCKQGTTTTIITVDIAANKTTIKVGSGPNTNYTGLPRGVMYVTGSINDLEGPARVSGQPPPAIADNTQMIIATPNDIVLQKDITYNDYYDGNSVLGLFSSNGNVRIGTSAPNDIQVNAFIMASGSSGAFQVDNYSSGSPRGGVHLTGGFTAQYYGAFGQFGSNGAIVHGYARDFHFDDRGLIPPYFPTTSVYTSNTPKAHALVWKEQ